MEPSIIYLIEVLIMLSEDENEKVVAAAANGLKLYSEKCEAQYGKSLLEILEDNFYNVVTKLPRILHGTGYYMYMNLFSLQGFFYVDKLEMLLLMIHFNNLVLW
jgi:hypothetical protein